ncbi:MAG: caspase family protein [Candidatus Aminicenantes bacterium]|nr:caspase family protein [Candidatus Aminicenantes bacterium]
MSNLEEYFTSDRFRVEPRESVHLCEEIFVSIFDAQQAGLNELGEFCLFSILSLCPSFPDEEYSVKLEGDKNMEPGAMHVNREFLDHIGYIANERRFWSIKRATSIVPVQEVVIELVVEQSNVNLEIENFRQQRKDLFLQRCILIKPGQEENDLNLPVKNRAYFNLRSLQPPPGLITAKSVLVFDENTMINLFVPHRKSGVDMVIVIDASGSMDLCDYVGVDGRAHSRLEGIKTALEILLQRRLKSGSRLSSIAAIVFGQNTRMLYPRQDGAMEELKTEIQITEMRDSIRDLSHLGLERLKVERTQTNISNAIRYAAELLDYHAQEGNEKMILLLSDGADWVEDNEGVSDGEVVSTLHDPAILADSLRYDSQVRIHTVSISDVNALRQYEDRKYWDQGWAIPNNNLLQKIAVRAEGLFIKSPDANSLAKFFEELGEGMLYPIWQGETDIFRVYENGFEQLKQKIDIQNPYFYEMVKLEDRLIELFNDSPNEKVNQRSERIRVLDELNKLAIKSTGTTFDEMCNPDHELNDLINKTGGMDFSSSIPYEDIRSSEFIYYYRIGPPIEKPSEFYGHQIEIDHFFSNLNNPHIHSLQIIGLHKSGKTSFLKYISHSEILRKNVKNIEHILVVYVSLRDKIKTPSDFYKRLSEAVNKHIQSKKCPIAPPRYPTKDSFDRWLNSSLLSDFRIAILLDDFEYLLLKDTFDLDFFNELRLLGDKLIWFSTSFRDYYRLSCKVGDNEKALPFFQVFHPTPIILGQITYSEAISSIMEPIKEYKKTLSIDAIEAIISLSGRFPFFLQSVAEKWFSYDYRGIEIQTIKDDIKRRLCSELVSTFVTYWKCFNREEKEWLRIIASNAINDPSLKNFQDISKNALNDLLRYGLLTSDCTGVHIANEIFLEWIKHQSLEVILPPNKPGEKTMNDPKYQKPKFKNAYAVLIGVGNYIHAAALPASAKDATAISKILVDPALCGYSPGNIQLLTNEKATGVEIRNALKQLAQSTDSESTVIVYFSGHGVRTLENKTWYTYICPREIQQENIANTAIPGSEFSELLAAVPSQKMLVIIDSCHAGGSANLKTTEGETVLKFGLPDDYYEVLGRGSGRVIFASSKEDQVSYVRPQGDLSVFTWHLLDALSGKAAVRGDGLVHVLDVFHHINEAVQADKPNQTPILKVKDMDLNFPIALSSEDKGNISYKNVTPITGIREQIIHDPIQGAKALSDYLKTDSKWALKRNEVDLKRSDLENSQGNIDLFGPDPTEKAGKNKAIFHLLRLCLDLEKNETTDVY